MTTLREFLPLQQREIEKWAGELKQSLQVDITKSTIEVLEAHVEAAGGTGARRIRIRGHEIISDNGADYGNNDLGPNSPELLLGALGSCLTHVFMIRASQQGIPLDSIELRVTAEVNLLNRLPGNEHLPNAPQNITYVAYITSPADKETIDALKEDVARICPISNLIKGVNSITSSVEYTKSEA